MRKAWFIAVGVLLALTLSVSALAISNKKPISQKTTLTFNMQGVAGDNLDLGQPGESLGDQFVSSSILLKNGTKVGRIDSVCSITNLSPDDHGLSRGLAAGLGSDLDHRARPGQSPQRSSQRQSSRRRWNRCLPPLPWRRDGEHHRWDLDAGPDPVANLRPGPPPRRPSLP